MEVLKCDNCKSSDMVMDFEKRELYCSNCGQVLQAPPEQGVSFPFGVILG